MDAAECTCKSYQQAGTLTPGWPLHWPNSLCSTPVPCVGSVWAGLGTSQLVRYSALCSSPDGASPLLQTLIQQTSRQIASEAQAMGVRVTGLIPSMHTLGALWAQPSVLTRKAVCAVPSVPRCIHTFLLMSARTSAKAHSTAGACIVFCGTT
jgi:hypothetical protein